MLQTIGSIIITILALSVLIVAHEFGHFIMARWLKVPVAEFSVGMGPKLYQHQGKQTKFSIRWLLLGGYCAFETEEAMESGNLSYNGQPVYKRALITLAGPVFNAILAFVLLFVLMAGIGLPTNVPKVDTVEDGLPAQAAGLQPGDVILSVNGQEVGGSAQTLSNLLSANGGAEALLVVDRGGTQVSLVLQPFLDASTNSYRIGILLGTENQRLPLGSSLKEAVIWTGIMVKELFGFFGRLIFRGEGAGDVSGIVGSVAIISSVARNQGLADFIYLMAYISVNLGVFNMLPIPTLDGSRLVFLAIEKVRGKPVPPDKESMVHTIGLVLILILFVILTWRDISRLLGIGG